MRSMISSGFLSKFIGFPCIFHAQPCLGCLRRGATRRTCPARRSRAAAGPRISRASNPNNSNDLYGSSMAILWQFCDRFLAVFWLFYGCFMIFWGWGWRVVLDGTCMFWVIKLRVATRAVLTSSWTLASRMLETWCFSRRSNRRSVPEGRGGSLVFLDTNWMSIGWSHIPCWWMLVWKLQL